MSEQSPIFSTPAQLVKLQQIIINFLRLPFSADAIPGSLLEAALAYIHNAEVLHTYDFVDVLDKEQKIGWQVKATKSTTPVTWLRAKIPNAWNLIDESKQSIEGRKHLGDSIIDFCNAKAIDSLNKYQLEQIGYARLILFPNNQILYFEKQLINQNSKHLFNPDDYEWHWTIPKNAQKKEQLTAFCGIHKVTNVKHFAWHGLGENQLHFSGENVWWPATENTKRITFNAPTNNQKVDFETIAEWLSTLPFE